jgi:hypothetical protein
MLPTPVATQPVELHTPIKTEAQESQEPQLSQEPHEETEDNAFEENAADDDFGDFGQFSSTAIEMFPATDEGDTRFARFNSQVENQDIINGINVIWPVSQELESKPNDHVGLFEDNPRIMPSIVDRDWVDLYRILVNDTVFSENGGSRLAWRRSMIRQRFLESLNISEVCLSGLKKRLRT